MGALQRVLNAAARLVTDTRKYNRGLSMLIHGQLHWLNVTVSLSVSGEQSTIKVYLVNCCTPVADIASRHRRPANLHRLIVPRYRRSTLCRRASVGGSDPVLELT